MSFIRNGTAPAIAGNQATGSQPFGMNGMIVNVVMKVMVEPSDPRAPSRLSQNPANKSAKIVHSDAPKNRAPPRRPKAGYSQKMKGLLLMNGIISWAPYGCHFVYPKAANMNTITARSMLYSNFSPRSPSAPM